MPEDGPVVQPDGVTIWYRSGIVHRDDGPAIERADGSREWYAEGVRHCDSGAAVISPGEERRWFQHGKELTEGEFNDMRRRMTDQMAEEFHKGTARKTHVSHALNLKSKP